MTIENNDVEQKQAEVLALDDILRSKEKREALFSEAKRFALEIDEQKRKAKNLNEDIKAIAEDTFGIKAGTFKEFINAVNGNLEDVIQLLTSKVDVLEILKEQKQKKNEVEGDE